MAAAAPRVHVAAGALLLTTAVHLALTPAHLDEAPLLGVLFAASGVAGILLTISLYAHARGAPQLIVALLGALIAGYVITRMIGYEDWDGLGLVTVAIEIAGMVAIAPMFQRRRRGAGLRAALASRAP
jgi:hypothetical protein